MKNRETADRLSTHSHWPVKLMGFVLILVVAQRRRFDLTGVFNLELVLFLLGLFTLLYATESLISRRINNYHRIYFVLQMIIVEVLGIFQEYQDTWALLFIVLGFQVATQCTRKEALLWYTLFTTSLLITLSIEFGVVSGVGRAMAYGIIGVLIISFDIQYSQHQDALAESQMLVAELQEAHQKLVEYAAQVEKLAALQERNRMVQELYDSVGQKIFAIQLAAETVLLLLEQDPGRASIQLDDLQLQTQSTLGQMRQLIEQWRPA